MTDVRDAREGVELQLKALGPQDAPIHVNPEMSFFDHEVDPHGAFASTPTPVEFPTFDFSERNRVILPKSGDLLQNVTVEIRLPVGIRTSGADQNKSFLKRARLCIDDSLVQDLEGLWLDILEKVLFDGRRQLMSRPMNTVYIPLRFVGNMPIYAMFESTVYVDLELVFPKWLAAKRVKPQDVHVRLLCDFVTLDAPERAVMLNTDHELMYGRPMDVDAVTYRVFDEGRTPVRSVRLDLSECNAPCVFFAIVAYREDDIAFNYMDAIESVEFQIDGAEQFESRPAEYYRLSQTYQHSPTMCLVDANVYVYSFGLKMNVFGEKGSGGASTGHLNLSGVRNPTLVVHLKEPLQIDVKVKAFVATINWLRLANGYAAPMFV